ncbi:MAG TPA: LysM peptidoglycan-binding domain-containing protein [Clostridia bacterium]|nr:LysM peptidoglycan-binding domain-containing protein [Clostridia bacterium]
MSPLHRNQKKKIKVTNKARLSIFISILLVVLYPAMMFAIDKPHNKIAPSFINVYIEPGDTLWDIAKANLPPKTDIRDFIHEIKSINELDSALIVEGDSLLVPFNP